MEPQVALVLQFLGHFQVTRSARPVTAFESDKVRALLAYLAVEGAQPHSRSALTALLWPDYEETSARGSLRQALYQLRQVIGDEASSPPLLLITRQTLQFNSDAPYTSDVATFSHLLQACTSHTHAELARCLDCLTRLRQAVDLYQGEFLAGFVIDDSAPFEEWRRLKQEQFQLQALDALATLAEAEEASGAWEQVQRYARRQLALEPWREETHRQLMRSLARSEQRGAAIAQYQICRQVLATEFGLEPAAETTALYEQIRRGDYDTGLHQAANNQPMGQGKNGANALGAAVPPVMPIPSPAVPQPPTHNLPAPLTPLVGQAPLLAEISRWLQGDVRLLTLVGPGGVGKTRLAIEVGFQQLPTFADGVYFVPLAALNRSELIVPTIATAIGLSLQGSDPRSALRYFLHQKQVLLILDNFEQLLSEASDGAALVSDLLQSAPGVRIIVTSREQINLRGEQVYRVPPLTVAPQATLAEAANASAVRLFMQCAQRVQPGFQLTSASLAAVVRICLLVQGIPLGLELAAAHVGTLPLAVIAHEIAQSAEFLAVAWRDVPERQRSMRAVFTWSWQLLTAEEQRTLRQISIFRGDFTGAAAQAVTGASVAMLTRLLQKSLLQWQETTDQEGRYSLHELIRQFAAIELNAVATEQWAAASRHSEYYLAFAASHKQRIMRNDPRQAVQTIQGEIDNVRQAWRWGAGLIASPLVEESALALREFYWLTGLTAEAIEVFTFAIQARRSNWESQFAAGADETQRAEQRLWTILLGLTANLLIAMGQHEEALRRATDALHLVHPETNPEGAALAYLCQGQALRRQGSSAEAQSLLTQAVEIAQQAHKRTAQIDLLVDIEQRAYSWLCSIALSNDDYLAARAYATNQLQLCRRFQKFVGETLALTSLVDIDTTLGNYGEAQQNAEQSLAAARNIDFRWGQALCLEDLAAIAWAQGNYGQAQKLFQHVLAVFHEIERPLEEATNSHTLGRLCLRLGDYQQGRGWIDKAFELLRAIGLPARETFWATLSRAWLHHLTGEEQQALVDAQQGWLMAQQLDGRTSQAHTLVLLGLIHERLVQPSAAEAAYRAALHAYQVLGHFHHTAEPRAGLARLALVASNPADARREVEEILLVLEKHPLAGYDEPFQVYLTCYTVFAADNDARAASLLHTAQELVQTYARQIDDPTLRHTFLQHVATQYGDLLDGYHPP